VPWRRQLTAFIVGEQPRARQETLAGTVLQREHAAHAGHHVDDQLRVLPVLELVQSDVERRTLQNAHAHIGLADAEFAHRVAHRRTAVAAPPRLEKHQRAVALRERVDQLVRGFGCDDARRY
jgi:hypothetical protein